MLQAGKVQSHCKGGGLLGSLLWVKAEAQLKIMKSLWPSARSVRLFNTHHSCSWMEHLKPSRTLRGSWAQKPFCVPHFLFAGNRLHSASMTFPEFQRAGSNSANQEREERRRQGRSSPETIAQTPTMGTLGLVDASYYI